MSGAGKRIQPRASSSTSLGDAGVAMAVGVGTSKAATGTGESGKMERGGDDQAPNECRVKPLPRPPPRPRQHRLPPRVIKSRDPKTRQHSPSTARARLPFVKRNTANKETNQARTPLAPRARSGWRWSTRNSRSCLRLRALRLRTLETGGEKAAAAGTTAADTAITATVAREGAGEIRGTKSLTSLFAEKETSAGAGQISDCARSASQFLAIIAIWR
jgi:hypothetical protein